MKHDYAKIKLECLLRDLNNYTADEFRRQMMRIASGATGEDIPDDAHTIKAERDALAAQIAAIQHAWEKTKPSPKCKDIDEIRKAVEATPGQHLAEIRAEAVKAFADEIGVFSSEYDDQGYVEVAKWKVQEHIAKVRQGGAA